MPIGSISNGESGLNVRTKLNLVIDKVNLPDTYVSKTVSATLSAADLGKLILANHATVGIVLTLPVGQASFEEKGWTTLSKIGAADVQFTAGGTDKIGDSGAAGSLRNNVAAEALVANVSIRWIDSISTWIFKVGAGFWETV